MWQLHRKVCAPSQRLARAGFSGFLSAFLHVFLHDLDEQHETDHATGNNPVTESLHVPQMKLVGLAAGLSEAGE